MFDFGFIFYERNACRMIAGELALNSIHGNPNSVCSDQFNFRTGSVNSNFLIILVVVVVTQRQNRNNNIFF